MSLVLPTGKLQVFSQFASLFEGKVSLFQRKEELSVVDSKMKTLRGNHFLPPH